MIRFLFLKKFGFLKTFRIAVSLLQAATKIVFFEHYRYFIFSFFFTLVQFLKLYFTGFIHSKLKLTFLLSESLAGLNYFEVIFEAVQNLNRNQVFIAIALVFIELYLLYIISCATAYYAMQTLEKEKRSIKKSFKVSLEKTRLIAIFTAIEVFVLLFCALIGTIGNIIYFLWQLLTVFKIQIITFDSLTIQNIFIRAYHYFKKNITNIVTIDLGLELSLLVLLLIGSFFYQKLFVEPVSLLSDNYFIIIVILYMLAVVQLIEVIAFTMFYRIIKKQM